jgi:signal transduction histidine kinase
LHQIGLLKLQSLSIRQKVAITPAIAIAVLCILAIVCWSALDEYRNQIINSYKELVLSKDQALRLPHTLGRIRTELYKLTIWSQFGVPGSERDAAIAAMRADLRLIKDTAAGLETYLSVEELRENLEHFEQGVEIAIASIQKSPIVGFSATRRVERVYEQAIHEAEAIAVIAEARFDRRINEMATEFNHLLQRFSMIALAACVVIIFAAYGSASAIAKPVRDLAAIVNRFSRGHLEADIPWSSRRDEIGLIARAIESFKTSLLRNRELEREREQTNQRLEHKVAERTRELDEQATRLAEALNKERELNGLQRQFVSMVSHEFRTPLAIIDGSAQRILRRLDQLPTERMEIGLTKIRTAVARLTDLMESVLSAARLEAGSIKYEPAPCKMDKLVEDLCHNYQELNSKHKIIANVGKLPPMVHVDVSLIRQVFSNLISNAIKYSPEGTEVLIVGESDEHGGVQVSVQDQGYGIPADELDKLFDRYFRASTSTGIVGTGIGLHLVKMLVEMHAGTVTVSSTVGEGTCFTVRLPPSSVNQAEVISEGCQFVA